MKRTYRLGIALIPSTKSQKYISKLTNYIYNLNKTHLKSPNKNMPHMTLFQGKFKDKNKVLSQIKNPHFNSALRKQKTKRLTIWAREWLFLEFKKNQLLTKIHNQIIHNLLPYKQGKAIDFLDEKAMTPEQRKSFNETGYQFSKKEFMPHITLLRLKNPNKKILIDKPLTK